MNYRAELRGLMLMMAEAWEINSCAKVKAYCDNRSKVDGLKKFRNAIGQEVDGVAPNFKHAMDLWEEAGHWCWKWKQKFEIGWVKEYPEKQNTSR